MAERHVAVQFIIDERLRNFLYQVFQSASFNQVDGTYERNIPQATDRGKTKWYRDNSCYC